MKKNAYLFLCVIPFVSALANPQGASIVSGEAALRESGSLLEIQASDHAIINWDSFSIHSGEITRFVLPSHDSALLSRVVGKEMSRLMGELQCNGALYLINPQGVIIGKDAVINTSSLMISTLNLADEAFLHGKEWLFTKSGSAGIVNLGTIHSPCGRVVLLGHFIDNQGTISAEGGEVALVAGEEILLQFEDKEHLFIRVKTQEEGNRLSQTGVIKAVQTRLQDQTSSPFAAAFEKGEGKDALELVTKEGRLFLSADFVELSGENEADKIAVEGAGVIFHQEGRVHAPSGEVTISTGKFINSGQILAEGGSISISTKKGSTESALAKLQAQDISISSGNEGRFFTSAAYDAPGGMIQISGDDLVLAAAKIDVSSQEGGGIIRIGGETSSLFVNASSEIKADALSKGKGGEITLFATGTTECHGYLSAKGGPLGGAGGSIDVSGKGELGFYGNAQATAPLGKAGSLLLDPQNLIFSATGSWGQYPLVNPTGQTGFGTFVISLTNGNVAVANPSESSIVLSGGAVFLFDGLTGALKGQLFGVNSADFIGRGGLTALPGGKFVISSYDWNGTLGAATFVNGTLPSMVSPANSLVGTSGLDFVSASGLPNVQSVVALPSGDYVVGSFRWNSGLGAATLCAADGSTVGPVTSSNSLVGANSGDQISLTGIFPLPDGSYVVCSPFWNNFAGAATFSTQATAGTVSSLNSLTGTLMGDLVSEGGAFPLVGGGCVISSFDWQNAGAISAGAVTFSGDAQVGPVTTANSFVGTHQDDMIGSGRESGGVFQSPPGIGVVPLPNGNYVVVSPFWNGERGAVTLLGPTAPNGTTGSLSAANSLVGTTPMPGGDNLGISGVAALTNNDYVIASPNWSGGLGAVTYSPSSGITGSVIDGTNSLIGALTTDMLGLGGVFPLPAGAYVISSPQWSSVPTNKIGAATFHPAGTIVGTVISASNSLIGSSTGDQVSSGGTNYANNPTLGITVLPNGNYVVTSSHWSSNQGAATFGSGVAGVVGTINSTNSLVGTAASTDQVGSDGVTVLGNGNYVVASSKWNSQAGAATFGSGVTGVSGTITAQNSVTGTSGVSGLFLSVTDDNTSNQDFLVAFSTGTSMVSGAVIVGLENPNQITYARGNSQTAMTIPPSFVTQILNNGTAVTVQASNDITIGTPITYTSGSFSLSAGRNVLISQNITSTSGALTITANDPAATGFPRQDGLGNILVGNGVSINTGSGNLTLQIGNQPTFNQAGFNQAGEISLGLGSSLSGGNLLLIAGTDITAPGAASLSSTGTMTLVCDNAFPTSPQIGPGKLNIPGVTLTSTGYLWLFTADQSLNILPPIINGFPFVKGQEFVNSTVEKWDTYYPNGSQGFPFRIFYKTPLPIPVKGVIQFERAISEPLKNWMSWYLGGYLEESPYAPFYSKTTRMLYFPPLVSIDLFPTSLKLESE